MIKKNIYPIPGLFKKKVTYIGSFCSGDVDRSRLIKKEGWCSFDLTDLPRRYTKIEGNLFWAVEPMATKLRPLGEELVLITKKRWQ